MSKITVLEPIMCKNELIGYPSIINFIVGFWVRIHETDISISMDEMVVLNNIKVDMTDGEYYKEKLTENNDHPQFTFTKEGVLKLSGYFNNSPYRYSVIQNILRFINISTVEIQDNEFWFNSNNYTKSEFYPKQHDYEFKQFLDFNRNKMIEQLLEISLPDDEVRMVMNGERILTIERDTKNHQYLLSTSMN